MKKLILSYSSGKKVLFFFLLSTAVYILMIAYTIPHVMNYANGMKLLDMMPAGYNFEYVSTLFEALGEQGRAAYLSRQIPVDMVYPFLYAVGYGLMLAYFFKKLNKENSPFFWLSIFPFIAGIADYLENIGSILMLSGYPNISELQVKLNSFFTILKSGATTIGFLTLFVLIALFGLRKLRKNK